MNPHDFLVALGASVLLASGFFIGCHCGIRIERHRWHNSIPTLFPSTTRKHWQKKVKEPIPEHDL